MMTNWCFAVQILIAQEVWGTATEIASPQGKVFLVSSILPKNELKNSNFCPSLLGQKFFVRFLEELKNPKFPFEIN